MKKSGFYLFCILLLLALFLISRLMQREEKPVTLTLSVAQSLKDVIDEILVLNKDKHPEFKVVVNLGGSGSLQRQIEQGAPVDLFISASVENMEQLKAKGLLYQDSYWELLKNRLVLVAPKDVTDIMGFEGLLSDHVKAVALGEPQSVPAGKYALEALSYLGIDEDIKEKSVYAKDVREVATWVESGNAEAGLVYLTDALNSEGLRVVEEASQESHTPIVYPVGIMTGGHVKEAQKLVELLFSEEAASLFKKYGFTPISGEAYGF